MSALPSKQEVIVIDSDEDKGEEKKDAFVKASTDVDIEDNDGDETVDYVREIVPQYSQESIRRQLKLCHGSVEEAVDALLRIPVTAVGAAAVSCKKSPPVRKRSKLTVTARTTDEKDTIDTQQRPTKRALFKRPPPSTAISDERHDNTALSPEWHACYQRASQNCTRFIDPDFGPVSSSLDGRYHASSKQENDNNNDAKIECCCGLPVAARQVQSDGPNYGRFYLTCGRVLRQKRRAAVAVIKADSPSAKASPTSSPRKQPCNFFQWDPRGSLGGEGYASSKSRFGYISWHAFGDTTTQSCLYRQSISPDQVQQGAIGNCWFLSALAVVAEKSYLVQRILPHTTLNAVGCYQVNFCLDGDWEAVIVDSYLPVIHRDASKKTNRPREGVPLQNGIVAVPAFCATPQGQLWAALVEKAYAKAHGSYAQLSGGFIAEGLADLTGAPCETIVFDLVERELLWGRLLSFAQADFAMGVATSGRKAQQGLVSCHAYSVLEVIQLDDVVVGEQTKVTDFFGSKDSRGSTSLSSQTTSVRLVRIRNPWGMREFKGDWSAQSTQWTHKLRKLLPASWRKGDGTFFMSYEDMLQNFHHMDVCKTYMGWHHTSQAGTWSRTKDPLRSSTHFYRLVLSETTSAFISLIQPKKRANTESSYWYVDPSLVILRRRVGSNSWDEVATCCLSGIQRITSIEAFLEPSKYDYICIPFSCYAQSDNTPFRLVVYSAKEVRIKCFPSHVAKDAMPTVIEGIHNHLLKGGHKLMYPLSRRAVLVCSQTSHGCYFIGLNASHHYISLRITVDCPAGIFCVFGDSNSPGHDLPPGSQKILLVLSGNGRSSSTATQCHFRYASAVETFLDTGSDAMVATIDYDCDAVRNSNFGGTLSVTMIGELCADSVAGDVPNEGCRGEDRFDTYSWIPQIGSSIV